MANLAYFQVMRDCNQYCRFCSNPPTHKEHSIEEGFRFIDDIMAKGWDGLILTGGEPTLSDRLPEYLRYCRDRGFPTRIITNGQRLADPDYARSLKEAGLGHAHISLHSVRPDVQAFLTQTPASLPNQIRALDNLAALGGIEVQINTVINKYNADHLDENVSWLTDRFPFIRHFVWNNLDPRMNRATRNRDTIHRLADVELTLHRAMSRLARLGKTFRVEKMPLCYLHGFEHVSTETRKIVKDEVRRVAFLDKRGDFFQDDFRYGKAEVCGPCSLKEICGGLFEMDHYYSSRELHPVFVPRQPIVDRILAEEDGHAGNPNLKALEAQARGMEGNGANRRDYENRLDEAAHTWLSSPTS